MEFNQKTELVKQFKGLKREGRLSEWRVGFRKVLKEEKFLAMDWGLKEQFEMLVPGGRDMLSDLQNFKSMSISEAVTSADFATVNNELISNEILKAYESQSYIGDQLVRTVPTKQQNGEKLPGITGIGDDALVVPENQPYPESGFSEDWVEVPGPSKLGHIVSLSKESVYYDKTMQVLAKAATVGDAIGLSKEKQILSLVTGITNSYNWRGTAIDSYGANAGNHDWQNLVTSTALQDWTDVDKVLQVLMAIADPNTGEPINNQPNTLLVPPALVTAANRILNAIHVEVVSNTNNTTRSPNPGPQYQVLSNQHVKNTTSSNSTWYLGDFKAGFLYMEAWPMIVTQQIAGSTAEFERDLLWRYRASESGVAAVYDPRKACRVTG